MLFNKSSAVYIFQQSDLQIMKKNKKAEGSCFFNIRKHNFKNLQHAVNQKWENE